MNNTSKGNGRQTAQKLQTLRARKEESTPLHVTVCSALGRTASFFTRMAACRSQNSYQGTAATEQGEERYVMNDHGKWSRAK